MLLGNLVGKKYPQICVGLDYKECKQHRSAACIHWIVILI